MYLTEKAQKVIKWIAYGIQIILIALVITFGAMTSNRGKTINQDQIRIKALTEQVDSLKNVNSALGAEDVFTVNVSFNITQKNVLSFSQTNAQNIAREVATMTRQELYDSLYAQPKAVQLRNSKNLATNGTVQPR